MSSRKITDLIKQQNKFSYSFEVLPDISDEDISNLQAEPVFFSVTWHAKSHNYEDLNNAPLRMVKFLRSKQKQVLMHLSCDMLRKDYLNQVLAMLQEQDMCNLFVIFGDNAVPSDFKSSQELIAYIRSRTGNYFCIGVAGSPDHSGEKLLHLKDKVENGADFILTQPFFEKHVIQNFVKSCKDIGINIPIVPGVFLFENIKQLIGCINLCKVKVSQDLLEEVKIKEESDIPGREIVKKLLLDVIADTELNYFHFFTMNKLIFVSEFVKEF